MNQEAFHLLRERSDLQRLADGLHRGYDRLNGEERQWVMDLVLAYVREQGSVAKEPLPFVKHLCKATRIIIQETDALDDLLDRVYQFALEGVQLARVGDPSISAYNLVKMESHLLGDAGDAAAKYFRKTRDIAWAERWYEAELQAATIVEQLEPDEAAHFASFAADAAGNLYRATEDLFWGLEWYHLNEHSAQALQSRQPDIAQIIYLKTASAAYYLHQVMERCEELPEAAYWAEQSCRVAMLATRLAQKNPRVVADLCDLVVNAAEYLSKATSQPVFEKIIRRYSNKGILAQLENKAQQFEMLKR